jgi:hypothetical protein
MSESSNESSNSKISDLMKEFQSFASFKILVGSLTGAVVGG